MTTIPLFKCTQCGVDKPHDTINFWTKTGYVHKREIGKIPATVCRECVKAKMKRSAANRWTSQREYAQWIEEQRAERMKEAALMRAPEISTAQVPVDHPEVIMRTDESPSGLTLEERKRRAKPIDI